LVRRLSEFLQAFLHDSISSYEELETLLLLVREHHRGWSDGELAAALGIRVEDATRAVDQLTSVAGLLEVTREPDQRRIQYAPKSKMMRQVVEELAVANVEQRLAIVQLMSANALERVRGAAVRRLANAFRIRGPKR
jgi:DNA-binding MarR family transcriptional regulator